MYRNDDDQLQEIQFGSPGMFRQESQTQGKSSLYIVVFVIIIVCSFLFFQSGSTPKANTVLPSTQSRREDIDDQPNSESYPYKQKTIIQQYPQQADEQSENRQISSQQDETRTSNNLKTHEGTKYQGKDLIMETESTKQDHQNLYQIEEMSDPTQKQDKEQRLQKLKQELDQLKQNLLNYRSQVERRQDNFDQEKKAILNEKQQSEDEWLRKYQALQDQIATQNQLAEADNQKEFDIEAERQKIREQQRQKIMKQVEQQRNRRENEIVVFSQQKQGQNQQEGQNQRQQVQKIQSNKHTSPNDWEDSQAQSNQQAKSVPLQQVFNENPDQNEEVNQDADVEANEDNANQEINEDINKQNDNVEQNKVEGLEQKVYIQTQQPESDAQNNLQKQSLFSKLLSSESQIQLFSNTEKSQQEKSEQKEQQKQEQQKQEQQKSEQQKSQEQEQEKSQEQGQQKQQQKQQEKQQINSDNQQNQITVESENNDQNNIQQNNDVVDGNTQADNQNVNNNHEEYNIFEYVNDDKNQNDPTTQYTENSESYQKEQINLRTNDDDEHEHEQEGSGQQTDKQSQIYNKGQMSDQQVIGTNTDQFVQQFQSEEMDNNNYIDYLNRKSLADSQFSDTPIQNYVTEQSAQKQNTENQQSEFPQDITIQERLDQENYRD